MFVLVSSYFQTKFDVCLFSCFCPVVGFFSRLFQVIAVYFKSVGQVQKASLLFVLVLQNCACAILVKQSRTHSTEWAGWTQIETTWWLTVSDFLRLYCRCESKCITVLRCVKYTTTYPDVFIFRFFFMISFCGPFQTHLLRCRRRAWFCRSCWRASPACCWPSWWVSPCKAAGFRRREQT